MTYFINLKSLFFFSVTLLPLTTATPRPFQILPRSIPGPPPDPPQPSGDGTASGIYKSGGSPTFSDHEIFALCKTFVYGADLYGWNNAAAHMNHYLDNTGTDYENNVEDMMHDIPQFRTAAQTLVNSAAKAAYEEVKAKGPDNSQTFQTEWAGYGYFAPDGFACSKDWYYADGAFSYSASGEVSIGKGGEASLQYVIYVFDRYNWDAGKSTQISFPIIGTKTFTDDEIGRLNKVGLARVYVVRGKSAVNTVEKYEGEGVPLPGIGGMKVKRGRGDGCPGQSESLGSKAKAIWDDVF